MAHNKNAEQATDTKFREFDGPRTVDVHLVDHVLDLGLGRVLSGASHRSVQFLKSCPVCVLYKKNLCILGTRQLTA